MKYEEYMKSQQWFEKRDIILKRDNFMCKTCSSKEQLQVHHNNYNNLGNESSDDLITLCKDCHTVITNSIRKKRYDKHEIKIVEVKQEYKRKSEEIENGRMEKIELQNYKRSTPIRT